MIYRIKLDGLSKIELTIFLIFSFSYKTLTEMTDKLSIFISTESTDNMTNSQAIGAKFDSFGEGDETTTWWASDYMEMLGYPNMKSFINPINRAMQACIAAGLDAHDNFSKSTRVVSGETISDYKLTRFACYMVAMNGDIKKTQVAIAQAYFAKTVEQVNLLLEGANDVERLVLRDDIKTGNKSLAAAARVAGVITNTQFAIFQDSGYMGMYNMGMKKLLKKKGVSDSLYDYMGRIELSANAFRIALTEEKLKARNVKHPIIANGVHKQVGEDIRKVVRNNTGMFPEQLPIERKLNDVNKELKKANKQLNKKKNN